MTVTKSISPLKLERLLVIDEMVRSRQRQTAEQMADALSVSERTLRSDLAFLRDRFNAPLEFDFEKGFYYEDPQWRLPTVPLTQGELFALTLGANALATYAGSVFELELRRSIQQLADRLPETIWVDLQRLADERINFRIGAELLNLDPHIYQDLLAAWKSSQQLWIKYFTANLVQ